MRIDTDIWIDSEKNGFGTYRYTDASGDPTGNGDDAWVNRVNRVMVRIRNIGPGIATNVRVQVFVNSPPGMGDAGPDWAYLGTIIIPSISAGGVATDFVNWTPTVGAHTCIKAVIDNIPGELSTSNNLAQENVSAFDTSTSSPFKPIAIKLDVFNPFKFKTPIHFNVRDVPRGWGVVIDPTDMVLPPGGRDSVHFIVYPSGGPDGKVHPDLRGYQDQYRPGFIGRPKIEAQVPYADTFIPIGGVDVWTHLTNPTKLTCEVADRRVTPPTVTDQPRVTQPPGLMVLPQLRVVPKAPGQERDLKIISEFGALVRRTQTPPNLRLGQTLVWRGELTPNLARATIAVEFTNGKRRQVILTKTDEKGRYQVRFGPSATGLWSVQAFFAGDMTHESADSNPCPVQVGRQITRVR